MRFAMTAVAMVVALLLAAAPAEAAKPPKGPEGKLFWRFSDPQVDRSPDVLGLFFATAKRAYVGAPEGGLPRCKSGCVRYSFNPRNGKVKVGQERGTYRNGKLKLGQTTYFNTTIPKPRTRYALKLITRGFSGLCGLILGCTTWREDLVLTKQGEFVRSGSSIGTIGGVGTPFVYVGSFPPDEHGTYEILGRGRIRLTYADGSTKTHTIAVNHTKAGKPDAVREGLLLDDTWFYFDEDD